MTAAAFLFALTLVILTPSPAISQERQASPSCADDPSYNKLDFWLGEWEVFDGEQLLGNNRIEKILDGCAVTEHWTDRQGSEGRSLFYLAQVPGEAGQSRWKQVWVTDFAVAPGGTKEKILTEELQGGGLRFQGQITLSEGRTYLDRTTLIPQEDGTVHQRIEISTDGGQRWRPVFDAEYRKKALTSLPVLDP